MYVPAQQSVELPENRRARRLRGLADFLGKMGSYAAVSIATLLVAEAGLRYAFLVLAGNLVLVGVAIGCALRWRSS
jgi:hypothetical protein